MNDNNGTVRNNAYDAVDRLTQTIVGPAASVIGTTANTYQYDGLNRATRLTDNNDPADFTSASTVTFAYDTLSRVVEETQNGKAVDGAWSAQARRTALTYPNGRPVNFTYDLLERIQTIKDNGAGTNIAQYTYIGSQRVLQRQYQNGTQLTHLDNAGITDTGYDGLRRTVMRRDVRNDNSLIVGFGHAYDREDNKSYEAKLHSTSNSELYNYDSAYRITDFQRGQLNAMNTGIVAPSLTEDWTLDGVGNWRVDTVNGVPGNRLVNPVNEYTNINGGPLAYDQNGNLTAAALGYRWDYKNRLRQVCSLPAGATVCTSPGTRLLATYSYDALNRRTRKVVTNSGALNGTTNFYYDGWRTIEERDGADTVARQYVYGIDVDEPLIMDPSGGQRLFYHQNTLSSTFALTDSGGNIIEGYEYDAYGGQTVFGAGFGSVIGTVSAVANPYMYTGQRFDPESGLYYYRARYYDPLQGRFLQRDPLGLDVRINFYEYALGQPTRYTDPYGLEIGDQPNPDYSYADEVFKYYADQSGQKINNTGLSAKQLGSIKNMVANLKSLKGNGTGCPTVKVIYVTTKGPGVGVPEFAANAGKEPCTISWYFGHGANDAGTVDKVKKAIGGRDVPKVPDGKNGACMAPRYGVYSCFAGFYNSVIDPANRATAFNPMNGGVPSETDSAGIADYFNKNFTDTKKQIADMCKCCDGKVELRLYFGSFRERQKGDGAKAASFSKW